MSMIPIITQFDIDRLDALIQRLGQQDRPPATLDALEDELDRATVVTPAEVPPTVVTMNSEVRITELDTGCERRLTVVFPSLADIDDGRISVLAPMGLALLGARQGETVSWRTHRGTRTLRVEEIVFQPEAAGRFDL